MKTIMPILLSSLLALSARAQSFPLTNAVLKGPMNANSQAITNASDVVLAGGASLSGVAAAASNAVTRSGGGNIVGPLTVGESNSVTGPNSFAMGKGSRATGYNSFAGGHGAIVSNNEAFVWAATSALRTNSYDHGDGSFSIYAPGGVWMGASMLYLDNNGFVRALPAVEYDDFRYGEDGWHTLGTDAYRVDPGAMPTWPDMTYYRNGDGPPVSFWDFDGDQYPEENPCPQYWGDTPVTVWEYPTQPCGY